VLYLLLGGGEILVLLHSLVYTSLEVMEINSECVQGSLVMEVEMEILQLRVGILKNIK